MKTIFKVFGLEEQNLLSGAWLSSDGIVTDSEMVTFRVHQGDFKTELDALKFIETQRPEFEHGFEIVKVFVPN